MSLIECIECKKEVSDQSGLCLHCGAILNPQNKKEIEFDESELSLIRKHVMKSILILIGIGFLTFALLRSINNPVYDDGSDRSSSLYWLESFLYSWGFYIGDTIRIILKWLFTGW